PFMSWECGLLGLPRARRPCPQEGLAACMRFGVCTFEIFPCPALALGLGRLFFPFFRSPNPNPI
ncbi:hypothetical protein PUNSTDRAFT_31605, partial [Punctularia strigosozonata HHB-11173 SS5]|uniref:uncharacterized protein n=1 Tax=Punctularia strigosozonata (strain HHB-11173) TaxID=741275 RepID=UPI00044181A5